MPLTVALAVGWATTGWTTASAADDASDNSAVQMADYVVDPALEDSSVMAASYSTGKAGSQLTWLPYRPSEKRVTAAAAVDDRPASAERAVQFAAPGLTAPQQSGQPDPFDDPFGDSDLLSQTTPPAEAPKQLLHDDLLEQPIPQLPPMGVLPQLPADEAPLEAESSQQSEELVPSELERRIAAGPNVLDEECPAASDLRLIGEINYDITPNGERFPRTCPLEDTGFEPRAWASSTFTWKAAGLCHKPAYFEDVHVERYGHSWGPFLQPIMSGGHFFLSVPILPYKMGLYPPNECIYTLGYYRPGNCAPYLIDPLPISVRAGLAQAGAVVGAAYALP